MNAKHPPPSPPPKDSLCNNHIHCLVSCVLLFPYLGFPYFQICFVSIFLLFDLIFLFTTVYFLGTENILSNAFKPLPLSSIMCKATEIPKKQTD